MRQRFYLCVVMAFCCVFNVAAMAQQSLPVANGSHIGIPYRHVEPVSSLNMSGALLALVLLGAGVAWVLRRHSKNGRRFSLRSLNTLRSEGRLKLVETLHLTPRSRVHLIEIDGQTLLIGESQGSLQFSNPAAGCVQQAKQDRDATFSE